MSALTRRHLALSVTLALVCTSIGVSADAGTLGSALAGAQGSYRGQGMTNSHDPVYAFLGRGQTQTYRSTVRSNTTYVIHADCGDPCTDVDLFVYDGHGNVVAKDTGIARTASVRIATNGATELRYGVHLAGCSGSSCAVGSFLMAQPVLQAAQQQRNSAASNSSDIGWGEVATTAAVLGLLCWATDCLSSSGAGSSGSRSNGERVCVMEDQVDSDGRGGQRLVGQRQVCY